MKNLYFTSLIITILFTHVSCTKNGNEILPLADIDLTEENTGPIDPADSDLLSRNLIFPEGSQLSEGNPPAPTNTPLAPQFGSQNVDLTSSNGSSALLNLDYSASNDISGVYLQVNGASTFTTIPLNDVFSGNGSIQLPIGIPTNVIAGSFCVSLCIYDYNNNISNIITICINVLELGTGNLQISLSWDTPTDQDLHVTDPSGTTIYYANRTSSTGGQLDRDDLDGFGPENVFWLNNAPDGIYTVEVDDYTGTSTVNNFNITISSLNSRRDFTGTTINGQKVGVSTFTKTGNTLSF